MSQIDILVDLRSLFGDARNQGPRPTCMVFAASDAHSAILEDGWKALSCEYAFYHSQRRSGRLPTQGAMLAAMLETLREDGQPEESDWPYLPENPQDVGAWFPPDSIGKLFHREGSKSRHLVDEIIKGLDSGQPVITLLTLSRSFYRPNTDGLIDPENDESPELARRHAVISVGYGTANGQRALLIRNSWGTAWGLAGYAWVTERFLEPRLFDAAMLREGRNVLTNSHAA